MKAHESILRYDRTLDCIHCGLCLPVCPTYRLTHRESASPRGRIYLMRSFAEGKLVETAASLKEIDRCLVCRACEPVCPSGVQFGEMMELTRDLVEDTPARSRLARTLKRLFFRKILPHPARLRIVAQAMRLYQRSGLKTLVQKLGLLHPFGEATVLREAMMPAVPAASERRNPPAVSEPFTKSREANVGFLVGCVAHELLPNANRAAINVLRHNGCTVICPRQRPCCGALPMHFGDLEQARNLALLTMASFDSDLDAIVVSSAGCASSMKEYASLFAAEDPRRPKAQEFAAKVRDFSEYLLAKGLHQPTAPVPRTVAYDAPCHLLHAQGIDRAPVALLAELEQIKLVPLAGAERCCGAAGLSSMTEPEQSLKLLEQKIEQIRATGADVVATANPGCQLQLQSGVDYWLSGTKVMHVAELLELGYRTNRGTS